MQEVHNIGDRFWYMTPVSETDRPILGMVVGKSKTLMIDAGNSEDHARSFLSELAKRNVPQPDLVALTHWHWDHIFGLSYLPKAISISSVQTKKEMEKLLLLSWSDEALEERVAAGTEIEFCAAAIQEEFSKHRDITITLPAVTFENRMEIDLGGVTCILQHVGGDHAADSVVMFIPEEKLLFLGDSIYPDIFSPKRNYTIKRTRALLEVLESFDAETYILSHWKPMTKQEFQKEAALLRAVARYTEEHQGQAEAIRKSYENETGQALNEDELETIEYFVNGYEITGSE